MATEIVQDAGRAARSPHGRWADRPIPNHEAPSYRGAAGSRPSLSGNVDLLTWFSEDERHVCESCGERSAVGLPEAVASFCLHCGAVMINGARVDVDARVTV